MVQVKIHSEFQKLYSKWQSEIIASGLQHLSSTMENIVTQFDKAEIILRGIILTFSQLLTVFLFSGCPANITWATCAVTLDGVFSFIIYFLIFLFSWRTRCIFGCNKTLFVDNHFPLHLSQLLKWVFFFKHLKSSVICNSLFLPLRKNNVSFYLHYCFNFLTARID